MELSTIPLRKIILKEKYENRLPEKSIIKASSDQHSKRKPRPCGLTIHPAIGCTNQCIYCYIQDMGFNFKRITPYGLNGLELAYALLSNPYYMPTMYGTYLAIGSVTEPFHELVVNKTIEYLRAIEELENPVQFSTKEYIDEETAKKIAKIKLSISPLITIVTIEKKDILEPNAKEIDLRLKTIRNLKSEGLKPMVFIRPIIPGVTDVEAEEIINEAKRAGAVGIVAGNMRITSTIIKRMKNAGLNLKGVIRGVNEEVLGKNQIYVKMEEDIKGYIVKMAEEKGLKAFKSSCCANAYVSGTTCINLCRKSIGNIPKTSVEEVEKIIKTIVGKKPKDIILNENNVRILMEEKLTRRENEILKYNLRIILRRTIDIA
ncbi:MAG: radical SAM protein [Candidatus Methanomethylicia archaeon]